MYSRSAGPTLRGLWRPQSKLLGVVRIHVGGIRRYDWLVSARVVGDCINFLGAGTDDTIAFFGQSYWGPYKLLWAESDDTIVVFRAELLGTI